MSAGRLPASPAATARTATVPTPATRAPAAVFSTSTPAAVRQRVPAGTAASPAPVSARAPAARDAGSRSIPEQPGPALEAVLRGAVGDRLPGDPGQVSPGGVERAGEGGGERGDESLAQPCPGGAQGAAHGRLQVLADLREGRDRVRHLRPPGRRQTRTRGACRRAASPRPRGRGDRPRPARP